MVGPEPIDTTVSKQARKDYYCYAVGFFVVVYWFVCLICYAKRHSNTSWFSAYEASRGLSSYRTPHQYLRTGPHTGPRTVFCR